MKQVLQIILGKVPEHLVACVQSVKNFAERKKVDYVCIASINDVYQIQSSQFVVIDTELDQYLKNRLLSEFIRTKYLSENPETLYVDWDIFLNSNFTVLEQETFGSEADALIYNSQNNNRYKLIYDKIKNQSIKAGTCILAQYLWPLVEIKTTNQFNEKQYRHFFECRSRGY